MWAGHVCRQTDGQWSGHVFEWIPRLGNVLYNALRHDGLMIWPGRLALFGEDLRSAVNDNWLMMISVWMWAAQDRYCGLPSAVDGNWLIELYNKYYYRVDFVVEIFARFSKYLNYYIIKWNRTRVQRVLYYFQDLHIFM